MSTTFEQQHPVKENRLIPLATLSAHPSNYRQHPEEQIHDLIASLTRFGQTRSIVVQEGPQGNITVAGHGVVEAARKLGYQELRADIIPADWSPAQVKGYLIADNQHAQKALDDEEQLLRLLQEQQERGYSLDSLGSDEETLRQMLAAMGDGYGVEGEGEGGGENGKGQETEAGSLLALLNVTIADPVHKVHTGEVWQLGKHVLLCVHVFKDWSIWNRYLTDETCLFLPFAGPLVPLSKKADEHTLVMVQPDTYIAGHVLDRYSEIHGEHSVRCVKQFSVEEESELEVDEEEEEVPI
jgi:hypothetical protein